MAQRRTPPKTPNEAGARLLAAVEHIADELTRLRQMVEDDRGARDTLRRFGPSVAEFAAQVLERTLRGR